MAYNTTAIKTDVNGKPIPQYFDPLADEYKPLLGQHGAARSILYGPDGQPIGTVGNPLQVKAHDTDAALSQIKDALGPLATETKLEAVRTLLASLVGKDFATQTTLAQIKQVLDTLNGVVSTSSNQDALKTVVDDLKSELLLVKSELETIKANQLSGDQKVTLSGTMIELIKEHIGVPTPSGTGVRFIGETTGGLPLNVSGYREVAITIRNQGSAETQLYSIQGFNGSASTDEPTITDTNGGQRWKIPAGARLVLNRHNTEVLKNPNIGLRLAFFGATEESVVDVEFVGVK